MAAEYSKKRKREVVVHQDGLDTSKPTAVFEPKKGRSHTFSIAVPGSIIANAQRPEQKTALASQIARAAAVFCVDEIVIFNDGQSQKSTNVRGGGNSSHNRNGHGSKQTEDDTYTGDTDPDNFLYHVLSYLETPPHLRRHLFPIHPNLDGAGSMPSLDMPHHMKAHEWCQYREGVTLAATSSASQPGKKRRSGGAANGGASTLVDCGLPVRARVPVDVEPNTRVTVKFDSEAEPHMDGYSAINAEAVTPDAPREEKGYYWGYSARIATSLSAVFTECPYAGGYDVSIGTSERGVDVKALVSGTVDGTNDRGVKPLPQRWSHMLLVFGGVAGLEKALEADDELQSHGVVNVEELFDYWVNLVPDQGSRTIRTEEAVWLGLMGTRELVRNRERR